MAQKRLNIDSIKEIFSKFNCLRHSAIIITIAAFIFVVYSNALNTGFQLDDQYVILNNNQIKHLENYLDIHKLLSFKFSRIIPQITFALNYKYSKYNVEGYHLVNILIHIVNSLLVYFILLSLFDFKVVSVKNISKHKEIISAFSALIFALHPLQIQAVTYITQRMASLAAMFYFLATFFYIKARQVNCKNRFSVKAILFYFGVLLSFYLGIHSKQNIASLPLALLLVELIFVRDGNNKIKKRFVWVYVVSIVILAFIYIFLIGIPHQREAPTSYVYFATQLRVVVLYIFKLFFPVNLQLYYNFPWSQSLFGFKELFSLFIILFVFLTAYFLYKKCRLLTFGIVWFFVTLSVESSIFPLKFAIFEYRVYPGMLGFGIFLTTALYFFLYPKYSKKVSYFLASFVLILALITHSENFNWKDGISLWKTNLRRSPDYALVVSNVGTYFLEQHRYDSALVYFNKAIKIDSTFEIPYVHRGVINTFKRNFAAAIKDFKKAIKLNKEEALAYNNLGYAYLQLGQNKKAIKYFLKAIELSPKYQYAYNNLAIAYMRVRNYKEAYKAINKAIKLNPENADYYNNRGNIHFLIEDFHAAIANYKKAIRLNPKHFKALNNLGIAERFLGRNKEAIINATKALKVNPKYAEAYVNRGLAEYNLGNFTMALKNIDVALALEPHNPNYKYIKNGIIKNLKIAKKLSPASVQKLHDKIKRKDILLKH